MSSPLSFFRRNQKVLLAVFGVLIMLTFVVGDYISRYQGSTAGAVADEIVVTWKHGKIDERELWALRDAHNRTVRFLDLLVQKTIEANGQPKGLGVNIMNGRVFDPGIPRSYAEEDLVQTLMLARKAQELGVRISDAALDEFLDTLTDEVVPRSQFAELLKEATQGVFDRSQLFEQLRIELSAQHMRMMAGSGVFAMSPSLAWDGFNRMNRRVKAELLPLPVADFDSQVTAQPTDVQVAALYEEGKDRYASPDSPEAGFKRRRTIAFQYLKADFEKFLQEQMASITKEQVAEYYEKNKNDFKVTEAAPAAGGEAKPADPQPAPDEAKKVDSEPAAKQPPVDKPAAKQEGKDEAKEDEVELKLDAPASNDRPKPDSESKQSRRSPRQGDAAVAFVSYNAEVSAPAPAEPAAQPAAGDAPAAAAEKEPVPEAKTEAAPEPAAKAETPPEAAAKQPPQEAPQGDAGKEIPKEPAKEEPKEEPKEPAKEAPATSAEPPQYKPLAEVEQEIRRNLARAPAQDKVNAALKAARAVIDKHFRDYASWQANAKAKVAAAEPVAPDIQELAKAHRLVAGETPLVDELQIGDYELGKAFRFSFAGNQFRRESFAEIAYTDRQPLYKADQIRSFEVDVEFLYWKTKEEESFVPELADIREEVAKVWEHGEAYRIAQAEAEKMAKELPGDKPLKESLPKTQATQVLEPAEFTWLTRGAMPMSTGAPMLNSVEGVEFPSHDFMRAVFALQPGEIGTAANAPQTVVYIVRIAAESPDEETRRKQFIDGGMTGEISFLARVELQTFLSQWYRDLEKEMELHWLRPPQAMQMSE
jgi:hypothetical protein